MIPLQSVRSKDSFSGDFFHHVLKVEVIIELHGKCKGFLIQDVFVNEPIRFWRRHIQHFAEINPFKCTLVAGGGAIKSISATYTKLIRL